VSQSLNDLLEDGVKLLGEFDTIVLTRPGEEERRLRGGAVTHLVRLEETQDLGQSSASAGAGVTTSGAVVFMFSP